METDANPIDPTTPRLESEPAAPKQAPLGAAAASGAAWGILATMVTKIGGFIANIFLARLLLPESFGEFAKAGIVIAFAVMPRDQALPQVLMHRQDQLKQSENSAFWLSIVLGLLSGVLMGGAGLYLYLRYGTSVVVWLLILASIASPLQAIGVVPWVALQAQFRFRFIARIGMLTVLGTSLASVILAWARWGAYSLLVPALLFSVLRSAALLGAGRTKVEPRLGIDQWWSMARDSGYNLLNGLAWTLIGQCDYLTLSAFYDEHTVGLYFFAFNLSIQVLTLFSANMSNVLLAALAKLKDERERQVAAFLRACRVFACFAVPACIVQIVLGRPGILLLFGRKWEDSILMFQILAAGMTVPLVTGFAWPMLQAQGRFRFVAAWTTTMAVIFLLMVQIGTRWHGAVGTAYAIAISHVVLGLIGMRLALSRDGSWKDVASVFVPSTIASIVAGFAGFGVLMIVPRVMDLKTPIWLTLLLMAASSGVFALVYALIMRTLWRSHYLEMREWTMAAVQRAGRSVFRQT